MQFYRYGLPVALGAGQQAGMWHAVLEVDAAKFKRQLEKLRRTTRQASPEPQRMECISASTSMPGRTFA